MDRYSSVRVGLEVEVINRNSYMIRQIYHQTWHVISKPSKRT